MKSASKRDSSRQGRGGGDMFDYLSIYKCERVVPVMLCIQGGGFRNDVELGLLFFTVN